MNTLPVVTQGSLCCKSCELSQLPFSLDTGGCGSGTGCHPCSLGHQTHSTSHTEKGTNQLTIHTHDEVNIPFPISHLGWCSSEAKAQEGSRGCWFKSSPQVNLRVRGSVSARGPGCCRCSCKCSVLISPNNINTNTGLSSQPTNRNPSHKCECTVI